MCISADTEDVAAAADFLVDVLSEEAVAEVARQGYLVPANVAVATSDDFLQPGRAARQRRGLQRQRARHRGAAAARLVEPARGRRRARHCARW